MEGEVISQKKSVREVEAKWLSDKITLDKHFSKWKRDKDGFLIKDTKEGCIEKRVSLENSDKWVEQKNEELVIERRFSASKEKISDWASRGGEKELEVLKEMKLFIEDNGEFTITELKTCVQNEIRKSKEQEKEKVKEIKEVKQSRKKKEFEESEKLFQGFGSFTNYLEMAKEFHKTNPFYYDEYRIWWFWDTEHKKWKKVDDVDLMNGIDKYTFNPTTNLSIKNEILEALKRIGRKNKPKEALRTWVQFKDVIVDIKTGERFLATPEYFISNPIPWNIGKSENTPAMDKLFREWVYKEGIQDESYVKTLYEIMAYCILAWMPIHRIFCLIGEGLNGKGTFLRLIEKVIGSDNACATELEVLSTSQFESSKLFKKLVCFIGEVDKGIFKKTKTLKSLTGEDTLRIEFKRKDSFDGKNYANPLIATNHLPETSDRTKGFYRRWTIVDFPNQFNEKKDVVEDVPEEEFENFCLKSINILRELVSKGEFTNDGTIQEREDKYERHSNHINEFISRYCNINPDSSIDFAEFCEMYNEYLTSEGLNKKSKIEIGRSLKLKGYEKKVKKIATGFTPTTKTHIFGIKFSDEITELE